jgi:hypothetical protein
MVQPSNSEIIYLNRLDILEYEQILSYNEETKNDSISNI